MRDIVRKGHEFQEERSGRALTPGMLNRPPRNIDRLAESVYQGASPAQSVQKVAEQADNPTLTALRRQATLYQQVIGYTTVSRLILPAGSRTYLILQNLDAAAILFVGFGFQPNGTGGTGLRIAALQAFEPIQVPQNDVFVAGSANGNMCLIYAVI